MAANDQPEPSPTPPGGGEFEKSQPLQYGHGQYTSQPRPGFVGRVIAGFFLQLLAGVIPVPIMGHGGFFGGFFAWLLFTAILLGFASYLSKVKGAKGFGVGVAIAAGLELLIWGTCAVLLFG